MGDSSPITPTSSHHRSRRRRQRPGGATALALLSAAVTVAATAAASLEATAAVVAVPPRLPQLARGLRGVGIEFGGIIDDVESGVVPVVREGGGSNTTTTALHSSDQADQDDDEYDYEDYDDGDDDDVEESQSELEKELFDSVFSTLSEEAQQQQRVLASMAASFAAGSTFEGHDEDEQEHEHEDEVKENEKKAKRQKRRKRAAARRRKKEQQEQLQQQGSKPQDDNQVEVKLTRAEKREKREQKRKEQNPSKWDGDIHLGDYDGSQSKERTSKPTPQPTRRPVVDTSGLDTSTMFSDSLVSNSSGGTDNSDSSIVFDGFEFPSGLQWQSTGDEMWSIDDATRYEGTYSTASGTFVDMSKTRRFSNLTLTTDDEFRGGELTFMALLSDVSLPRDAFYVVVDEEDRPSNVRVTDAAKDNDNEWAEHSIVVGRGTHTITWVYVSNPFGMSALPNAASSQSNSLRGARIDDLRLQPLTLPSHQDFEGSMDASMIKLTRSGDAQWQIDDVGASSMGSSSSSYSMVAFTGDIEGKSGHADASFVVVAPPEGGGVVRYAVRTSTTAPFEDMVVLVDGVSQESVFGRTTNDKFEEKSFEVSPGRHVITFRHRKNPGGLSGRELNVLNPIDTEGRTWVDNVRFEPNL